MMCERAIWLHRGRVCADGRSLAVGKRYQAHVREEEEIRLRARTMSLSRRQSSVIVGSSNSQTSVLYRLIGSDGAAPRSPCFVREIRYGTESQTIGTISLGGSDTEGDARLLVDPGKLNWSKAAVHAKDRCRAFAEYGGIYQHAPFVICWPTGLSEKRWLELVLIPSSSQAVQIDEYCSTAQAYRTLTTIPPSRSERWRTIRVNLPQPTDTMEVSSGTALQESATSLEGAELHPEFDRKPELDLADSPAEAAEAAMDGMNAPRRFSPDKQERYGSGEIVITEFSVHDAAGVRRHTVVSGEPATALLSYYAAEAVVDPVVVIAIYLPDGTCAMQLVSRRDEVEFGRVVGGGSFSVQLDPLLLGPGDYVVSVALFKDIDLRSGAEPAAYDLHDRAYLLRVLPPDGMACKIGVVNQRGLWRSGTIGKTRPALLSPEIVEGELP
jgi:homopolymeric O-antigen transport system ATP-binding protein